MELRDGCNIPGSIFMKHQGRENLKSLVSFVSAIRGPGSNHEENFVIHYSEHLPLFAPTGALYSESTTVSQQITSRLPPTLGNSMQEVTQFTQLSTTHTASRSVLANSGGQGLPCKIQHE